MRRAITMGLCAVVTAMMLQTPALAAGSFHRVKAATEGPSLLIRFVERGLEPGQNYAYTGNGTVQETFQCYRTRTFTPTDRTATYVGGVLPDPRAYAANANGVVRGFIYLWPDIAWPLDLCHGGLEAVPVGVCYQPSDLVDFVEPFDVFWFPDGTNVCGPIEPD